ncbi:MAG: uracil-DNA glycosylase [Cognaticolwellia sp.]|jgi:uracil-DNA glycosylase|tara:strand:+ start:78 stop:764 length:687 start_codon:yes stop_codon:yes gene_type:complete
MSIKTSAVKIEESWKIVLANEFQETYFLAIKSFLIAEKKAGKTIYPPNSLIFNAFNSTPFNEVNVVILGQDPYHGPNQAMGLSFSVPPELKTPASLRNIYKELAANIDGFEIPKHGDLSNWSTQGVFMLNAMLTVEHKKAGSHKKIGWQKFTDAVIKKLSDEREGLIFMLWGNFAKGKKVFIDTEKHHVLESVHPSPLAGNAFLGNRHFAKANEILISQGKKPINWQV